MSTCLDEPASYSSWFSLLSFAFLVILAPLPSCYLIREAPYRFNKESNSRNDPPPAFFLPEGCQFT